MPNRFLLLTVSLKRHHTLYFTDTHKNNYAAVLTNEMPSTLSKWCSLQNQMSKNPADWVIHWPSKPVKGVTVKGYVMLCLGVKVRIVWLRFVVWYGRAKRVSSTARAATLTRAFSLVCCSSSRHARGFTRRYRLVRGCLSGWGELDLSHTTVAFNCL